jgi:hypothetical protein
MFMSHLERGSNKKMIDWYFDFIIRILPHEERNHTPVFTLCTCHTQGRSRSFAHKFVSSHKPSSSSNVQILLFYLSLHLETLHLHTPSSAYKECMMGEIIFVPNLSTYFILQISSTDFYEISLKK